MPDMQHMKNGQLAEVKPCPPSPPLASDISLNMSHPGRLEALLKAYDGLNLKDMVGVTQEVLAQLEEATDA